MELEKITAVEEVHGQFINSYLKEGWVLLDKRVAQGDNDTWFMYSVGWPHPLPVKHPES